MTKWQSIKTAPRDGTRILLSGKEKGRKAWVREGYYERGYNRGWLPAGASWSETDVPGLINVTHWKPLPEGPK